MEKYIYITDFNYEGKVFKVFVNEYYQNYYLRVLDDGSLLYPNLDEFKGLFNIFNGNSKLKIDNNYDERDNRANGKNIFKMLQYVKLVPKVIYKTAAISLISAMVLFGGIESLTNKQLKEAMASEAILQEIDSIEPGKSKEIEQQLEERIEKASYIEVMEQEGSKLSDSREEVVSRVQRHTSDPRVNAKISRATWELSLMVATGKTDEECKDRIEKVISDLERMFPKETWDDVEEDLEQEVNRVRAFSKILDKEQFKSFMEAKAMVYFEEKEHQKEGFAIQSFTPDYINLTQAFDLENMRPTVEEIHEIIEKNDDILGTETTGFKAIAHFFVDEISRILPNFNLSILRANLETMKTFEFSEEEMKEWGGDDSWAWTGGGYDAIDNELAINFGIASSKRNHEQNNDENEKVSMAQLKLGEFYDDLFLKTCHELGHSSLNYKRNANNKIYYDGGAQYIGRGAQEAAVTAMSNKMTGIREGEYRGDEFALKLLLTAAHMSLDDFYSLGISGIEEELGKIGIDYIKQVESVGGLFYTKDLPEYDKEVWKRRIDFYAVNFLKKLKGDMEKRGFEQEEILSNIRSILGAEGIVLNRKFK